MQLTKHLLPQKHPTEFRSEKNQVKISTTRGGQKCEKSSQNLDIFVQKVGLFLPSFFGPKTVQKKCAKTVFSFFAKYLSFFYEISTFCEPPKTAPNRYWLQMCNSHQHTRFGVLAPFQKQVKTGYNIFSK